MKPCVACLALLAISGAVGAGRAPLQEPARPVPQKPPVAPPPAKPQVAKPVDPPNPADEKAKSEAALRDLLAKLYGDLVIAKARWDGAWAIGTTQTLKTALQNLAESSREFMAVTQRRVDLEAKIAALNPPVLSTEEREAIFEGLRDLERIARAHDDADYEYRVAPTEGGPTTDVAQKAWRAQRERLAQSLRETETRLRRSEWTKASFDEAMPSLAWSVPALDRFHALPDLDLATPRIGVAFPNSPLQEGDAITGVRHAGESEFTAVATWDAFRDYCLANAEKPGLLELRVVKAKVERTVSEPPKAP